MLAASALADERQTSETGCPGGNQSLSKAAAHSTTKDHSGAAELRALEARCEANHVATPQRGKASCAAVDDLSCVGTQRTGATDMSAMLRALEAQCIATHESTLRASEARRDATQEDPLQALEACREVTPEIASQRDMLRALEARCSVTQESVHAHGDVVCVPVADTNTGEVETTHDDLATSESQPLSVPATPRRFNCIEGPQAIALDQ